MTRDRPEPRLGLLVAWPLLFGLILSLLRVFILALFGEDGAVGPADAPGLVLGFAGQLTTALLPALVFHLLRESRARVIGHLFTLCLVVLNVAAFHYESVFGRLPAASVLYYIGEASQLRESAAANAPVPAVVLEIILAAALLSFGAEGLRDPARITISGGLLTTSAIATLGSAIVTTLVFFQPGVVPERMLWKSRTPILWASQSWLLGPSPGEGPGRLNRQDVLAYQYEIGLRPPFGGADPQYPLCAPGPREPDLKGNGRSVILLILESVAVEEMTLTHQGKAVMPALRRIADGAISLRIKASGTKSIQAMPALFAGVPPQTAGHLLWRTPLNHFEGFPARLADRGYRTAYFHGADLSFEQQRSFLRQVGFAEIIEYDLDDRHAFIGWGYTDDVVFDRLRNWIQGWRRESRSRPYFAAMASLSTHDPFDLPAGRPRVFEGEGRWDRFVESLRFLDEELERFYTWFVEHEAPRGTILVITGDHAPHLEGNERLEDGQVERFDVPLLIVGRDLDHPPRAQLSTRTGAQHDLPATIAGALALSAGSCDQGLDLLGDRWPENRTVYGVAGDQLEAFHLWRQGAHVRYDRFRRKLSFGDVEGLALSASDREVLARGTLKFYDLSQRLSRFLMDNDGFAPPPLEGQADREPVAPVDRPFFVAHRGQSRGVLPVPQQNRPAAIEQAIADGFDWIEIDVNLSRDGIPVVIHDSVVPDRAGGTQPVHGLTLDQLRSLPGLGDLLTLEEALERYGGRVGILVELKPQNLAYVEWALTRYASRLVNERSTAGPVIVDSFSPYIASMLEQHCDCAVGHDAPTDRPLEPAWVDHIASAGLDWIYVHHRQASPELIRYAHAKGLRVLVYTVNDPAEIATLRGEWPDAIITDRHELSEELGFGPPNRKIATSR